VGRRILITGVSGYWGTALARRLERSTNVEYVAGIDVRPPAADLANTEFIRADIRNPVIARLLPEIRADTIVHSDVLLVPEPGKSSAQLHDINVIGTLQLLAAIEKTQTVRTLIVRGSAAIYGAEPGAPDFFSEDMARWFAPRTRFQRDIGELESYFTAFAKRFPDITVTILRYQPTLGLQIDTPLTRYLGRPVVPTQLGFDPRLQFVHDEDAVLALEATVQRPARGAVNVAGEGSISLTKLLRLCGRLALPVPAPMFGAALVAGKRLGLPRMPPETVPWLRFGLTIDCKRLIGEVGFRPRSTLRTVEEFAGEVHGRRLLPGAREVVPSGA
jgi:UDP-glucose 4-epimerase